MIVPIHQAPFGATEVNATVSHTLSGEDPFGPARIMQWGPFLGRIFFTALKVYPMGDILI